MAKQSKPQVTVKQQGGKWAVLVDGKKASDHQDKGTAEFTAKDLRHHF